MRSPFYRNIWITLKGPIPQDDQGRSFEIHHKDGNRSNNDISNLECLSIDEHYARHLAQGDHAACFLIEVRRNSDPHLLKKLASRSAKGRLAITNGVDDRKIRPEESIPEGWWRGRTKGKRFGKRSPEFCKKVSDSLTGRKLSTEHRAKLAAMARGMTGKCHQDSTKRKISDAHMGKPKSIEHRLKMSLTRFGKIHITDGLNGKLIRAHELIPEGWYRGRPTKGKKLASYKKRRSKLTS